MWNRYLCWLILGWCALLLQIVVFCNCDVLEAEGSLSWNKSLPQTWFLKIMEFVASQHMLVVVDANHLPWSSDSVTWFLGFLSLNWLRLAPRCQLTTASVSFCFNSGVNQSTPSLSMLLLQASGCQQQPMLERIRVIGSFLLSRSSRCRKDRDRPVPRHSILKRYRVRQLSCWIAGQGEILRLSNGWLVCRSQNEYVVLPDISSWQSQNFFMESKIVKLLHIGWRFWFLVDRFLLLLDWLWLTQYLQCAESS